MLIRLTLLACVAGCLDPFPNYDDYLPDTDASVATASGETPDVFLVGPNDQTQQSCNGEPIAEDTRVGGTCSNNQQGACQGFGNWQCTPNGVECIIANEVLPKAQEECPGSEVDVSIDDDCDGILDEGCPDCRVGTTAACYEGAGRFRGVGVCQEGAQICGNDGSFGACEGSILPSEERCDGLNNDCDVSVDEGNFECASQCGIGSAQCENGQLVNCNARQPSDEICNNKDDDCNGEIDDNLESLSAPCALEAPVNGCSMGRTRCNSGVVQCEPVPNAQCDCIPLVGVSHRHYLCQSPREYDSAQANCEALGLGSLVQIESTTENRAIYHQMRSQNFQTNLWLGATREGAGVRWLNGANGNGVLVHPDDAINASAGQNRVAFNVNSGLWNFLAFTTNLPYLCEEPCAQNDGDSDGFTECAGDCDDNDPAIKPGQTEQLADGVDNNCNGLVDEISPEICGDGIDNNGNGAADEGNCSSDCTPMWFDRRAALICNVSRNWYEARDFCASKGSRLAEFKTTESWRQIWAWLAEAHTPQHTNYWQGLERIGSRFRYVGGGEISNNDPLWSNWANRQPDDWGRDEDCAELWCSWEYNGCNGTWNDLACETSRNFICLDPQ